MALHLRHSSGFMSWELLVMTADCRSRHLMQYLRLILDTPLPNSLPVALSASGQRLPIKSGSMVSPSLCAFRVPY